MWEDFSRFSYSISFFSHPPPRTHPEFLILYSMKKGKYVEYYFFKTIGFDLNFDICSF